MKILWEHGLMSNEMRERLHVLTGCKGLLRFSLYFLLVFPRFFWCVCCGEVGVGRTKSVQSKEGYENHLDEVTE